MIPYLSEIILSYLGASRSDLSNASNSNKGEEHRRQETKGPVAGGKDESRCPQ
jgi:hypothetical protein